MSLQRTAIVTGAGKRVGRDIAAALVADGWNVVAHVHHQSDEAPDGGTRVVADLEALGCADEIFAATEGLPPVSAHMAVNVRAPALLIERFARAHAQGEDALIVNLLDSKLASPNPDYLSYTLSKQALAALTELAARALAPRGIRVNGIAPGLMLRSSGQSEENFEAMHANNPLRCGVEAADVIGAIRYLVGARCVTGQTLVIDSGHRFLGLDRDVQFLDAE
jgi:NAD(P)-dependent dehydrogenase (short-subunit alcohol dehydrogenase family)